MSFLKASSARPTAPSPTPSVSSTGAVKRKRPESSDASNIVYSQPAETGTGQDIRTNLQYTREFLKSDHKWHTFDEILGYLNLPQSMIGMVKTLKAYCRSNRDDFSIEFDPNTDKYRYRPKYPIRNAAQLKGYLQNQNSALGLSVKDLKDGWPNCYIPIDEMEKKHELLVVRNKKDGQAKTVWLNDPSLVHKMDDDFKQQWHSIPLPPNPEDLRNKLVAANLKPSSAPRKIIAAGPKEKKRKAARKGGKQTNTHMAAILKDFSHLRK